MWAATKPKLSRQLFHHAKRTFDQLVLKSSSKYIVKTHQFCEFVK